MESLLDLPDDKLFEICEQVDIQTLSQMVQTSWKLNNLCNELLKKRLVPVKNLIGRWHKCKSYSFEWHETRSESNIVYVDDIGDKLEIYQYGRNDEYLTGAMEYTQVVERDFEEEDETRYGRKISKDDIIQLEKIYNELIERGFKNIKEDDIWIEKIGDDFIVNYPEWGGRSKWKTSQNLNRIPDKDVVMLLQRLGISLSGVETRRELGNLLFQEINRRGKVVICSHTQY